MKTSRKTRSGGGFPAIWYSLAKAAQVGPWRMWKKLRSRNACKTCAVGMGGQAGGMVNEAGHFPEVCKKSLQAQAADMVGAIDFDYFDRHDLSYLQNLTPKQAEDAGRLTYPVLLTEPSPQAKFKAIYWDTAMDIAAEAFENVDPNRVAVYASGRSSNEAAFLLQSFARVLGTNHVMNCSFYCHQASGVALQATFGTSTSTVELDDLRKSDLVIVAGSNPASNHPRMMTQLADVRARGGKVIVVNPLRETPLEKFHVPSQIKSLFFGTQIPTHYIQPYAGGDTHFFVGVLKALIESGKVQQAFLDQYTEGAKEVLQAAKDSTWDEIVDGSGVAKSEIEEVAQVVAEAKAAIFSWAMGLTHHAHGVDNVLALCNLALATGNVGKPGAGLLPLRGHSNVQGVGSVGFAPQLKDGVHKALEAVYGLSLTQSPGYDTHAMMEAADRGEIDVLICLGGNLWGSNPDSTWAARGLQKIKTIVYLSTKLNPGHFHGHGQRTLILPVLARDEEAQATSQESMFNFVRLSDGGNANVKGQMRAESEVICDLANRVFAVRDGGEQKVDWLRLKDHKQVRKLIAEVVPGWQELATIDANKKEFLVAAVCFTNPNLKRQQAKRKCR